MEVGYSFDVIEHVGCYLSVNIQPCNLLPEGILVISCAIEQNVTYIKDQFCLPIVTISLHNQILLNTRFR